MKLSKTDLEIYGHAHLQADAPIAVIAKQSGYKEHVVRRSIQKMVDNEIIHRFAVVNPHACGYHDIYLMFSFALKDVAGKRRAVDALQNSPEVSFMGEFGGDFQYGVSVYVKRPIEVVAFLDRLTAKTGPILLQKKISIVTSMTYFSPAYALKRPIKSQNLTYDAHVPVATLDEVDHQILQGLMTSDLSNNSSLARKMGIPNSTLDYRIKTLKERHVLAGIVYFLSTPHALDMHAFSVLLHYSRYSPELRKKTLAFCATHPRVHYFAEDIGGSDCEIGVRLEEPHHISAFVDEIDSAFQNELSQISHFPYLRRFKLKYYPFSSFSK